MLDYGLSNYKLFANEACNVIRILSGLVLDSGSIKHNK